MACQADLAALTADILIGRDGKAFIDQYNGRPDDAIRDAVIGFACYRASDASPATPGSGRRRPGRDAERLVVSRRGARVRRGA
jgi:hypothetical protein